MSNRPTLDRRAKSHSSYLIYMAHRVSGLLLACFLPIHFYLLSQSLFGAAELDRHLKLTDFWMVKVGEWGLVTLLTIHLIGGVRLLMIEFGAWRGLRKGWIQAAIVISIISGLLFLALAD
ncbi:succinate dehydrogenase, cytochrome b556 subunit [Polynucleobacter antarcticus]|uniref:Succinate dehydrogenase cytochrome b556 subunit n=1 Tax=Polynucleobacter antarcticus TaxID=1743162 RepID=A0A6M9PVL9_9BURK|nr:succinate dehydrogenase, cytochrome b556 subunit [Polynucleobacter antarcticus]QKM62987.1 succinate dehydrogenase, cytochrome b556 subunit [Polynucleobacter antarcticus]